MSVPGWLMKSAVRNPVRMPDSSKWTLQQAPASYGVRSGFGTIWSILTDDAAGRMCS
jgi:hypothetical protein